MTFAYVVITLWFGAAYVNIDCNIKESENRHEECLIDRDY